MSNILKLGSNRDDQAVDTTLEILDQDGIVAIPTETVYGLLMRESPATQAKLRELKGREADKPFARYLHDSRSLEALPISVPEAAAKLVKAFWPGPLTMVLSDADGTTQGFRCSSHPFVRDLTLRADFPLIGTSANLSGQPELSSGPEIAETFPGLELVIDDGPIIEGKASTVLFVSPENEYRILREGEVRKADIDRVLTRQILFVCTGNTCRSPMAEVIFRRLAEEAGSAVSCASAGVAAGLDAPASQQSRAVAEERGLDLSFHRSQPADLLSLADFDRIITMTSSHRDVLVHRYPEIAHLVSELAPGGDIADPFGGSLEIYRQCADEIETNLKRLLGEL